MARLFKENDSIHGYQIDSLLVRGGMAVCYRAKQLKTGDSVFFKQYKSPSVTVPWYRDYVAHHVELKRRIETTSAQRYVYRYVESFEAEWGHKTFFQVFEFIEKGHDLQHTLDKIREKPGSVSWEQRLTFAKVIMAGIHALHQAAVVHADLKPENLHLIQDDSIKAGYCLKLIDIDFSILADRAAPWHGHQNYVGSPGYFSPEHLRGEVPVAASDIFTCGIILSELLADRHPFAPYEDDTEYARRVLSNGAKPLRLAGKLPAPATNEEVEAMIRRCLNPDASQRPTGREVNGALNGVKSEPSPVPHPGPPKVAPSPTKPAPVAPAGSGEGGALPTPDRPHSEPTPAARGGTLVLVGADGRSIQFNVSTPVGKHICQGWGDDAKFLDVHQYTVSREDGQWLLVPRAGTTNQTLLNETPVESPTPLQRGDEVAVGKVREQGVVKRLPLRVELIG